MAHDVFISYSSVDKPTADAVCGHLEQAGVRCWIAPRDALGGAHWAASIVEAIRGCRVMVVVFSSHADRSRQVMQEVERAVHNGLVVLPFRIEDVRPTAGMELFLSAPHWLDALTPPLEAHIDVLVTTVRRLLGEPVAEAPPSPVVPRRFVEVPPHTFDRRPGLLGRIRSFFDPPDG